MISDHENKTIVFKVGDLSVKELGAINTKYRVLITWLPSKETQIKFKDDLEFMEFLLTRD